MSRLSQAQRFRNLLRTPAPKWAVLLTDMLIVAVCSVITLTLNSSGGINKFTDTDLAITGVFVVTYAVFSLLFHSYRYIIRLSATEDMYRIAMVCLSSIVVLTVATRVTAQATGTYFVSIWSTVIVGVFSFSLMMSLRMVLKQLYTFFTIGLGNKVKVLVLGSDIDSFDVITLLKRELHREYSPMAFLSLVDNPQRTSINGVPVIRFNPDDIDRQFARFECSTLIFTSSQLELMQSGFADLFLDHGIKLLHLHQVEEYDTDSNRPHDGKRVRSFNIEDLLSRKPIVNENNEIERQLHQSTVLITGAAGSIGSEIVRQVARFGAGEIVLIDQAETPMHDMQLMMQAEHPKVKIHLLVGDINDRHRMEHAFSKYRPRFVFHAAAYKHVPMMERNPYEAVKTNVFGTRNIADLSLRYGVERFVMISTDKAVNPTNIMGASKRIAEIYVQSLFNHHNAMAGGRATTRFITTRFGNVLGSNGSVIPLFRKQIENGGPVTLTHRDIIRYFMTIPEACSLVLEAGCMGQGGEIYIFDMGEPVKIYDLARRMISLAGYRPDIDIKIVETGLRPGEKLYEELLNDHERTISTAHSKIMIAKVATYLFDDVAEQLALLEQSITDGSTHDIVARMKHIVPEYISQNSRFESIDRENRLDGHKATHDLHINKNLA